MPSQVLPPEIWLSIIQRLRGRNPSDWARRFFSVHPKITDVQTSERLVKANLRSLALVCHQLYHLVRPFVYEVIHLTWNSQEQLPVHAQREYNVILQDPAVATFIRTLILRGFPSSQNASWQGLVSRMEKLQSVVLWTAHCASFIHHIPHSVTELDVRYLNWNADQLMRPSVYRRIAIVPLGDNETPTLEAVTSSTVALYTSAMGMTNLKQRDPSLQSLEGLKDLRIHVNLHSVLSEGLLDAEPPLNVERLVLSASLVNSASPGPIGHLPQLRYIQAPLNMLHHFQGHKTIDELVLTHRYALPVDSLPSLDFPALQKFTFEARGLENPLYAASVCCCQADALRHLTLWSVDQVLFRSAFYQRVMC